MEIKECRYKDHVGNRALPITEFRKSAKSKDGLTPQCKTCLDVVSERWRQQNLEKRNKQISARRRQIKEKLDEWKQSRGCLCCNEQEIVCLDVHHMDPSVKEGNLSDLVNHSWKVVERELQTCVVVCRNCHAKIHAGIIELPIGVMCNGCTTGFDPVIRRFDSFHPSINTIFRRW